MLKFNLDQILKDTEQNISEVSRDTGLSRKTLTQLSNNDSKGIQLSTLQKLMEHFNLPVEKFFSNRLKDVFISIIDFDASKMSIPVKMTGTDNLQLLQILVTDPDSEVATYYGYPIIISTLDSEEDGSEKESYAFTVLDLNIKDFEKYGVLKATTMYLIQSQYDEIGKILSKLDSNEMTSLFYTGLFLLPDIKKFTQRTKDSGAIPLFIDCFDITYADFLPISVNGDGKKEVTVKTDDETSDNAMDRTFTLHIQNNMDLTELLNK